MAYEMQRRRRGEMAWMIPTPLLGSASSDGLDPFTNNPIAVLQELPP
jgi:hypothetical protein